jgi:chloramphenicol O-acetyltransferase type B
VRRSVAFRLRRRALSALFPPVPVDDRLEELISVGRHTYPTRPAVLHFNTYSTRLDIGSFCSIAAEVVFITDAEHRTDWVTTFPIRDRMSLPITPWDRLPSSQGDIAVGNDVWIGMGATVLSGVSVGDGAVIGARALVSRDVPPYGIAVGNPATVVRKRFSDEQIAALLRIRWWNWPDELIAERVAILCNADVDGALLSAVSSNSPRDVTRVPWRVLRRGWRRGSGSPMLSSCRSATVGRRVTR